MQDPEHFVRVRHDADPRVPRRVLEPVAEAGEDVDDEQHREGRVQARDDVGGEVAQAGHEGDAALPEVVVDPVVQERGSRVSQDWGEEY